MRWFAALCLAAVPVGLFADQITLKNGDRVTGKIVKKDGNKVTIKTALLGEVSTSWESVTEVTTDDPVTIVLDDERTVAGRVRTEEGVVEVESERVPITRVKTLRNADEQRIYEALLQPGLLDLWTGFFDIGFSLARGNARTNTLSSSFNASRVTRVDKLTTYFSSIYSTARVDETVSATAEAIRGGWALNRNFTDRVLMHVLNDYEYDRFQNLDLRFVSGSGLGVSAIKDERMRLDLLGGGAYNRENFTELSRNAGEAYWGDEFTYSLNSTTSVRQSFRIFHNLSRMGEYRMNFDLGTATTLTKFLSLQASASNRFLSNPVAGRKTNDVLVTTGLRVKFSRAPK